jgi:hypothetical protein
MEQCCVPLAVEMIPGKHCEFSAYLTKRARSHSGARAELQFLIMEHCCGPHTVEIFPGKQENTEILAPILPKGRELSLEHAQKCIFLIMEQSCGPVAVEIFQESSVNSALILQKERELSRSHVQRCSFLIME